ncbi:hypothetical protein PF001_g33606, partial [Phytophthora fragariae]
RPASSDLSQLPREEIASSSPHPDRYARVRAGKAAQVALQHDLLPGPS